VLFSTRTLNLSRPMLTHVRSACWANELVAKNIFIRSVVIIAFYFVTSSAFCYFRAPTIGGTADDYASTSGFCNFQTILIRTH